MSKLDAIYTPKQQEIYKRCVSEDFYMLINHGAKRTGKTILNNDLFLRELMRVKKIATEIGVEKPMYIVSGATLGTISNNILTELYNKYGIEFKFDKYNNFTLFGVYCVQVGHSTIGHLEKIRGMTAYGAYINEGSLANEQVFDEIKSRCSGDGARILVDTNPDHPEHWLLKDYIQSDAEGIISYSFKLDDNSFLSERYKKNIKETTPSGMFTDRNINGKWVSGDGVVYADFDLNKHSITKSELSRIKMVRYFCGVDWGYEHYGVIVVVGVDAKGNRYVVEEHSYQHKDIDFWIEIGKKIVRKYGKIPFYCDSARPEYVVKFKKHFNADNANKTVILGIETVAKLMKTEAFFIDYENADRFREEIYNYIWHKTKDEPIKEFDDVMDAIRYAILTDVILSKRKPKDKTYKAIQSLGL
ncbi:PBSX family phage terminase large subunit [Oceanobacillus oncorhynchi]|uniref:PBSX family phage terminase large subunit n=1 Tax=Oceanobacillus oncorhynchi TaxID=545501 RepID=UPI001867EDE8|nr:PBSX family phage terminase large subunit [Oceanobacillus oncorhynchi]